MVGLSERHLAFRVGVVAQNMRNLLQNENHTDSRQQALDHARRKERRQCSRFDDAQPDLQHAADQYGEQERFERTQYADLSCHNGRQSGSRSTHAGMRTADTADNDAANDAGQQTGEKRCS